MRLAAALAALAMALGARPALAQDAPHDMAGMDHSAHGAAQPAPAGETAAEDDVPGNAPPPAVPTDHPADRLFNAARMATARAALGREGRWRGSALLVRELEYRALRGTDGMAWRLEGWTGGDRDRLVVKSEGETGFKGPAERVELAAVWRHAIDPWFNLEAGVRHDIRPVPQRTYAVLGIEGVAPYWIEVEGQVLVSDRGDLHLRFDAAHVLRLSRLLVLEPEARLDLALQDVPALRVGAGVERIELGARLGYEVRPELVPYIGLHWERFMSGTADQRRAAGDDVAGLSAVAGVRAFF